MPTKGWNPFTGELDTALAGTSVREAARRVRARAPAIDEMSADEP